MPCNVDKGHVPHLSFLRNLSGLIRLINREGESMRSELLPGVARDQLNLVLGFFPRVDAKASVVLAVDTGMAGYLASRLPAPKFVLSWQLLVPMAAFVLIGLSF